MTPLPPEAFVCLPLERAELPLTVWHIAVAALIGNAWGPVLELGERPEPGAPREGRVVSSGRWSGPMGGPPPGWCKYCGRDTMPGGERGCTICGRCAVAQMHGSQRAINAQLRELAARAFAPGPVPDFVSVDGVTYDMRPIRTLADVDEHLHTLGGPVGRHHL